jgi:hypothetical protein
MSGAVFSAATCQIATTLDRGERLLGVKAVSFMETPRKFLQPDRLWNKTATRMGGMVWAWAG